MKKIVINTDYGGFGLSNEAWKLLNKLKPNSTYENKANELKRDDPTLVAVIQTLGAWANGAFSKLAVIEIPDDVDWQIEEYDGREWISEKHRTWGK